MKTYSQVEGMLYGHYRKKNRIANLKSRQVRTINRIESLRRDLRECNIDLGETIKGIDYSRDMSGGGEVSSNIERELDKAVDNILKEITYSIRDKYKTISRISKLQKTIDNTEILLEKLTEYELIIIESRYGGRMGKKVSYEEIENLVPMGKSTIQRKHQEVINFLMEEIS